MFHVRVYHVHRRVWVLALATSSAERAHAAAERLAVRWAKVEVTRS